MYRYINTLLNAFQILKKRLFSIKIHYLQIINKQIIRQFVRKKMLKYIEVICHEWNNIRVVYNFKYFTKIDSSDGSSLSKILFDRVKIQFGMRRVREWGDSRGRVTSPIARVDAFFDPTIVSKQR